jgi:DNA-binding CsgD family transcriptional regulator
MLAKRARPMAGAFGDFGALTDAFMAAAVDPTRWNAAMDAAAKATASSGAILAPLRGRLPFFPQSDSFRRISETYVRDGWIHRDERYRSVPMLMRRGVGCEFDFTTPEEIARSAYYQEFLAPHGQRWFAGVKFGAGEEACCLSIQRGIIDGPFLPDELDRLAELSSRLASAAELARAFGFARLEAALDAFEASHSPVAMIDRMGEVVRLNRSAERLLGPDLQIARRRVVSRSRGATAALDSALHDLIWRRSTEACHPPIVLPRENGRPIVAYASRLSGAVREGFAVAEGFIVFVDLAARPTPVAADLMRVFGLTHAEARLADRLLGEESLEASAESLGVSYWTARNQLKAVLPKDGHPRAGPACRPHLPPRQATNPRRIARLDHDVEATIPLDAARRRLSSKLLTPLCPAKASGASITFDLPRAGE